MAERFVEYDGVESEVSTPAIARDGESPTLVIHSPAAISVVQAIIPYALPNVLSSNTDQRVSWLINSVTLGSRTSESPLESTPVRKNFWSRLTTIVVVQNICVRRNCRGDVVSKSGCEVSCDDLQQTVRRSDSIG